MLLKQNKIRVLGLRVRRAPNDGDDVPAFLLVELVTHMLAELLEFALGLCIVGVDHKILEVP